MASTNSQRKRVYDGKRLRLIHQRLREARHQLVGTIRLAETKDFQLRHQPNASVILDRAERAAGLVDGALVWSEERLWMHEQERAERIKQAGRDAA